MIDNGCCQLKSSTANPSTAAKATILNESTNIFTDLKRNLSDSDSDDIFFDAEETYSPKSRSEANILLPNVLSFILSSPTWAASFNDQTNPLFNSVAISAHCSECTNGLPILQGSYSQQLSLHMEYITCSRYIISLLQPVRFFQFYFVFQRSSSFDFMQLIDPVKLKLETFLIQWLLRRQ